MTESEVRKVSFARRLKERREELKLTQEELSFHIGEDNGKELSRQAVSKWEKENPEDPAYPEVQTLLRLSLALDISLDELFRDELATIRKKKTAYEEFEERYPGVVAGMDTFAEAFKKMKV